jgi:hypothetical protein
MLSQILRHCFVIGYHRSFDSVQSCAKRCLTGTRPVLLHLFQDSLCRIKLVYATWSPRGGDGSESGYPDANVRSNVQKFVEREEKMIDCRCLYPPEREASGCLSTYTWTGIERKEKKVTTDTTDACARQNRNGTEGTERNQQKKLKRPGTSRRGSPRNPPRLRDIRF